MSTIFASFNFWKAAEIFGEEIVDLNFPNNESVALLDPDCWVCSSWDDVLFSPFTSAPCLVEESVDPEDSCFPIPKVPFT